MSLNILNHSLFTIPQDLKTVLSLVTLIITPLMANTTASWALAPTLWPAPVKTTLVSNGQTMLKLSSISSDIRMLGLSVGVME